MGTRCIEQKALAQRLLNQSRRIDRFIEVDGVHKTDTANLLDLGHAGKLLAHIFAGFLHMLLKTIGKRVKRLPLQLLPPSSCRQTWCRGHQADMPLRYGRGQRRRP